MRLIKLGGISGGDESWGFLSNGQGSCCWSRITLYSHLISTNQLWGRWSLGSASYCFLVENTGSERS